MKTNLIITELYQRIAANISPQLTYHGLHHTIDVHNMCKLYILHYKINPREAKLLEIAAVAHDIGFLETYRNHEAAGAEVAANIMLEHNYTSKDIELVSGMIMATKIPQSPKNLLEQIICDSDLDYLGRNDFGSISLTLLKEWINYNIFPDIESNFDNIQAGFFKSHSYHTDFAKKYRAPVKDKNLQRIEQRLLVIEHA
jgi:predicted metal-dependent HD superfamily phosphohydrolase